MAMAQTLQGLAAADDFGGADGYSWDYSAGYGFDSAGNTDASAGMPGATGGGYDIPVNQSTPGLDWNRLAPQLISQGFSLSKQILQTQPGVYTQSGPNGTITYSQPKGSTTVLPIGGSIGGSLPTALTGRITGGFTDPSTGIVLLGVGALALFMMMRR